MKKLILLICFSIVLTTMVSCESQSVTSNETTPSPQTELKDDIKPKSSIEDLLASKNPILKVKLLNDGSYGTTQYFTSRVIEMLKRNVQIDSANIAAYTYDLKLCFDGYKDICVNTKDGQFWFDEDNKLYAIGSWTNYFDRCILKNINGETLLCSFEKDIIKQRSFLDIDSDGEFDDIQLYYDGDIRLKVKNEDIPVMLAASEDAISSIVPTHQYTCDLLIKEDAAKKQYNFLVGMTYIFTNKYGSTSWLSCYNYKNGELKEIWSSESELQKEITAKDYKSNTLTVDIDGHGSDKKIVLDQEQKELIKSYINMCKNDNEAFRWKDMSFEIHIIPQYAFYDYDKDGEDELLTRGVVCCGNVIILDSLISIYKFGADQITLKDSFFSSYNSSLDDIF